MISTPDSSSKSSCPLPRSLSGSITLFPLLLLPIILLDENSMVQRRLTSLEEEEEEADEHELVKEVLGEFPPEEKGERDEWNEHVGWHRKENIRKGAKHFEFSENNGRTGDSEHGMNRLHSRNDSSAPIPRFVVLGILLLIGIGFLTKVAGKKTKGRTQ
jgi:hypothetical protein